MKRPNPFIPRDSVLERRGAWSQSRGRIALYVVLALHFVFLSSLLIQGCKHPSPAAEPSEPQATAAPLSVTNPTLVTTPTFTNVPVPEAPAPPLTSAPPTPAPSAPPPPAQTRSYSVVQGDSFSRIAKATGVSLSALLNYGLDGAGHPRCAAGLRL